MKAQERGFKFLSMEGKVKIPFFQRSYVWKEENWDELWEELLSETKDTNFLGAIILKQIPTASGEPKQLEVIDGQQRLITLSILLKALYNTLSDENKRGYEEEVMEILKSKKDSMSSEFDLKIEPSYVDSDAYRAVMENDIEEINENSHPILKCYQHFYKKLKNMKEEEKISLLRKLLNPKNKIFVVIDLEEKDDEQQIFDTLNTAGVKLTAAEIVKNAIFKGLIELYSEETDDKEMAKEKAIEFYKKTWEETFLKDEETLKYWETERPTGRLKRSNLEILLHCIGVIKGFFDPDEHTLSQLSKLYKQEVKNIKEDQNIKSTEKLKKLKRFVEEIVDYAKIYRENFITFGKGDTFSFDDSIKRLFHILEELEISTFHPFLLYVFRKYNNENQVKTILLKLEKFIVRNMLGKVENVKNYNRLCKQFIKDLNNENLDTLTNKLKELEWNKVRKGLYKISSREAKLLLFWVELYRRRDERHDKNELMDVFELEHIMPTKWEEHWGFDKVPHPNSYLSPEEQKQDRNEKINWLGNMTLLKSKLNKEISNRSFEIKMEGEGRKRGIKYYAELSITKKDIVEPYEKGDKVWNERKIEERTEKLEREIKEIWGD